MLVISTAFLFSSCGLDYRYSLDEELHNKIEVIFEDQQPVKIIYLNNNYVFAGKCNLFSVDTYATADGFYLTYEDDKILSWNGYRYIWYIEEYYSNTADNPLFIYEKRLGYVYFHEDYDYRMDTFFVEGFSKEIVWNKMFDSIQTEINFESQVKVTIKSKQHPRIKANFDIAFIEDQWYVQLPDSLEIWTLSDEFVAIISKNEIV